MTDPTDPRVELVVGEDAAAVGREVRDHRRRGGRAAGFVGDAEADAEALAEMTRDLFGAPGS